ncbi:MAG: nitroreductase family protein [Oscillospiraceae bacterium]|nr:nitroreductase family protein [Oscillospiraceae bacterium]
MLYDLVLKNRSYRRFDEAFEISEDTLRELCSFARITPSGANRQFFKFRLTPSGEECGKVFPALAWAGYLEDGAPIEGERPSAYITIVNDNTLGTGNVMDVGIMAQTILLAAAEMGLGGCMIGSIKRKELKETLSLSEEHDIMLVIALGKPVEKVVIENAKDGDIKYWRDEERVHHVPKRPISELII